MAVQWFKGTVLFGLARLAKLLSSSEWRFRFFVAPSSEVALLGGGIFGDALAFGVHFALALPLGLGLLGDALLGSALLGDALLGDALLGDALLGESWLGSALLGDVFFGEALLFGALRFAALALGLAMAPFGALASLGGAPLQGHTVGPLTDPAGQLAVWKEESSRIRATLGVSQKFRPWTSWECFVGEGVAKTPRVLDLIVVAACVFLAEKNAKSLKDHFVDYSQSHGRRKWTNRSGVNPTLTTRSELYSFGEDRVVLPFELLRMHGFPADIVLPSDISPRQMRSIVGNGMSLPCLGTILWSLHVMKHRSFEAPATAAQA
eukprot:s6144_g4.t1